MEYKELLHWVGLRLIPQVGSVRFMKLVQAFGSPRKVLSATQEELMASVERLPSMVAKSIADHAWLRPPQEELEALQDLGGRVVTTRDEEYPPLLAQIYAPPPVLYVRGDLAPLKGGGIAVVGSRKVSNYGRRVAHGLGRDLAAAGVSTVSGLALGTDTAVHKGSLEAGGHTVGVLGCGVDVAYPPSNQASYRPGDKTGGGYQRIPHAHRAQRL
jgi:DNA processing protein